MFYKLKGFMIHINIIIFFYLQIYRKKDRSINN